VNVVINLAFDDTNLENEKFVVIDSTGKSTTLTQTYAQVALAGMEQTWGTITFTPDPQGYNKLGDYDSITATFTLNDVGLESKTPYVKIRIREQGQWMTPYNYLWDINGQQVIKAFMGDMNLYAIFDAIGPNSVPERPSESAFKNLAAHELGHLLGLGDAYEGRPQRAASTTPEAEKEIPLDEIMRSDWGGMVVYANTIEMILEAFKTNRLQKYDPENKPSNVIRSYEK
jgi:hypothetical protein